MKYILLVVSLLMLSACVATPLNIQPEFPESWDKPFAGDKEECLSISGVYRNIGESHGDDMAQPPTLDGTVFSRPALVGQNGRVLIKYDETRSVLFVNLKGEYTRPRQNQWISFEENISCEGGWHHIHRKSSSYSDGTFTDSEREILLARDPKGNLIVYSKYEDSSSSLLILRSSSKINAWYKFDNIEEKKKRGHEKEKGSS